MHQRERERERERARPSGGGLHDVFDVVKIVMHRRAFNLAVWYVTMLESGKGGQWCLMMYSKVC